MSWTVLSIALDCFSSLNLSLQILAMLPINKYSLCLLMALSTVFTNLTIFSVISPVAAGISSEPMNQSSLTIDRSSLRGSNVILQVIAPSNANLQGTIKLNGKVIANLQKTRSLSLQSCLSLSACEIDLSASYNPSSTIEVKLYSTNGAINSVQQSSGSGSLQQRFSLHLN
jgi:hypothetical protein